MPNKKDYATLFDTFEIRGNWWLPNNPDHSAAGLLKFTPNSIKLSLYGLLGRESQKFAFLEGTVAIFGEDEDGMPWSLLDCFEKSITQSSSEFIVNHIARGIHVSSMAEIKAAVVQLGFPGLITSLNAKGFSLEPTPSEGHPIVDWSVPKPFEVRIKEERALVKSRFFVLGPANSKRVELTNNARIVICFDEPKDGNSIVSTAFRLRNLLTVLHGIPCPILRVEIESQTPEPKHCVYFFRQGFSPEFPSDPAFIELLVPIFRLSAELLEKTLNNWFMLSAIANLPIGWFCGIQLQPGPNNHVNFVNLVQALESFHRDTIGDKFLPDKEYEPLKKQLRKTIKNFGVNDEVKRILYPTVSFGNRYSLSNRLKELLESLPVALREKIAPDQEKFRSLIVKTRDYITHLDASAANKAMSDEQIIFANCGLKIFFNLVLLHRLKIPENIILEGLKFNETYRLFEHDIPWK